MTRNIEKAKGAPTFYQRAGQYITDNSVEIILGVIAAYCRAQAQKSLDLNEVIDADVWTRQARSIDYAASQAQRRGL